MCEHTLFAYHTAFVSLSRHKYVEENVFILVLTAIIYFIPGAATLETHPSRVVCTKLRRGDPVNGSCNELELMVRIESIG